jgi:hypothetical protein
VGERSAAAGIFLASAAATLTISVPSPLVQWAYALIVMVVACWWTFYSRHLLHAKRAASGALACGFRSYSGFLEAVAMLVIAACGALQWITGATVYRYATLDAWTRTTALVAVAILTRGVLGDERLRDCFLRAFAWFATVVSVAAVLAYFTSPGRILWIFPSPYPDTWGPFLSRNDFAAFLELAFPVALWLGLGDGAPDAARQLPELDAARHLSESASRSGHHAPRFPEGSRYTAPPRRSRSSRDSSSGTVYLCIAAWLLAAGVASASRAGSTLLAAEALVILARRAPRASAFKFAGAAAVLIGVVGGGTLLGRWREPDAWRYRREIDQSALAMIAARPLGGFGLGTFSRVYPAYAVFDPGALVEHAHNDWLEWAAEGGVPYALAWCVVAVSAAKPAGRSIWGLGVIAVFLHAFVDYPFARFGVSAWTMALIGALGTDEMREVSVRAH